MRRIIIEYKIGFDPDKSKHKIRQSFLQVYHLIEQSLTNLSNSDEINYRLIAFPTLDGDGKIESKILFDSNNSYDLDLVEFNKQVDLQINKLKELEFEQKLQDDYQFIESVVCVGIDFMDISVLDLIISIFNRDYIKNKVKDQIKEDIEKYKTIL